MVARIVSEDNIWAEEEQYNMRLEKLRNEELKKLCSSLTL
jgi:hypothetical protein